jgi:hypothetical protein
MGWVHAKNIGPRRDGTWTAMLRAEVGWTKGNRPMEEGVLKSTDMFKFFVYLKLDLLGWERSGTELIWHILVKPKRSSSFSD